MNLLVNGGGVEGRVTPALCHVHTARHGDSGAGVVVGGVFPVLGQMESTTLKLKEKGFSL